MRLRGARRLHVRGWTGPLIEDAEPGTVEGGGVLEDGLNLMAQAGGRRTIRGGSRVVATFGDVSSNPITDCWGPFRYSATGAVAVGHAAAGSKHYAYALTDTMGWMAATEALSRGDLSWNSATPARPQAVELFEKVYFVDGTESASRQGLSVGVWASGAWTVSQPTYDLDGSGGSPGVLRAYAAEVFNGVLFVSGYDSESAPSSGNAPHMLRHSLLATDPSSSGGFDPDAYVIVGAIGQYIRALKTGGQELMVAKDSELYMIAGSGASLPGFQYRLRQISNSLGAGCTNPYALDHAYGMWYGVGRVGPWRTDGGRVELLRTGRDRSWGRVQNLELATVTAHPDRRQVWFGFHEVGRESYEVAPCTYWVWDIEREQWDTNQRAGRSFAYLGSVLQGASVAPSGAPGAPVQELTDASAVEFTAVEVSFSSADASAATEVYVRSIYFGAGYTLVDTVPAGIQRTRVGSLIGGQEYAVRLRHAKGGSFSDYSAETLVYTRLVPGLVRAGTTATTDTETVRTIRSLNVNPGATVTITDDLAGADQYTATYPDEPIGDRTATDTAGSFGTQYDMAITHPDWPVAFDDALTTSGYQRAVGATIPALPSQDLSGGLLYDNLIIVIHWPNRHGDTYEIQSSTDGFTYTTRGSYVAPTAGNPLGPESVNCFMPTAGTRYFMRVVNTTTGGTSSTVSMWTAVPTPTAIAATSSGAGTPVVNVAVTAAMGGHKLHVYNADRSYETTSVAVGAGVTNFATTAGTCDQPDRYWARAYNDTWPAGFQYSAPVTDDVANPCAVGT